MSHEAQKALEWIVGGDTGTSSKTIWSVMMGVKPDYASVPLDPDDFGRCYRLLARVPMWRVRLGEVAAKYAEWKPLVEAWDELTALYEEAIESTDAFSPKLYHRMQELRGLKPTNGPRMTFSKVTR